MKQVKKPKCLVCQSSGEREKSEQRIKIAGTGQELTLRQNIWQTLESLKVSGSTGPGKRPQSTGSFTVNRK